MKVGIMARIALPFFLSCLMASAVAAQQTVPETPPELRDFRLDPERAQPAPQPEVQPPPVGPATEPQSDAPRDERPAPAEGRPLPRQREMPADAPPSEPVAAPAAEAAPEQISEPRLDNSEAPETAVATAETPEEMAATSAVPWWQIAAALVAALALIGGWLIWQRRRAGDVMVADMPAASSYTPPISTKPAPPLTTVAKRPRLTLEFVPDKATLGFTALTLKGQLHLVNEGDAPASDMQLRATMISANQRQQETIAAFHGGAIPIEPNALGDAKEGERLALEIDMAVQLAEIDSYNIGDKKIFVPVVLANLAYSWDGGADNITIACMVGRESEPPGAKMGPLRLDRGPRSFTPLGQRPLTA
jgi:hypothetical protein